MTRRRFTVALLLIGALAAVAAYASACGDDNETSSTTPPPAASTMPTTAAQPEPDSGNEPAADGPALYAARCAGCHGADGAGGQGPSLQGEDNVGRVTDQVVNGGGGMPAFGSELSEREIEAIATYVTSGFTKE